MNLNKLNVKARSASAKPLKIGEVAKATGIGIETLRFYEKSGLLDHDQRQLEFPGDDN